ncbi:MAG: lipoyl(octanoyl) transferase [Bacteroidia bacterium]|jgi:lipoyl(octanoyl) transferase
MTVNDWKLISYKKSWDDQKLQVQQRIGGIIPDQLNLCEHNHVYTFGKSADRSNLLISSDFVKTIGAESFEIERGGDITYHGPGQLVGYPILDLNELGISVRQYVYKLEESIKELLRSYGIITERIDGLTGIWLCDSPPRKIGALGIKIIRGVTMHGFALNVNTDLSYFNHIVPCGITDKGVTSMAKELGQAVDMAEVKKRFVEEFEKNFQS